MSTGKNKMSVLQLTILTAVNSWYGNNYNLVILYELDDN